MIAMIMIFISLGLGTMRAITMGSMSYNFEFVEPTILTILLYIVVKAWKVNHEIKVNRIIMILVSLTLLIFSYSLFAFIWTDYGLSVLPGAIPLFYAVIAIIVSYYYLNDKPDLYILCGRIFILFLFSQLIINIFIGIQSGASGFYAVKAFASTLIGKSNFISFFFVFYLLFEFISKEKHWKFFLLINTLAVVLTVSRGAIVSLVLSLAVFFVIGLVNKNFNTKNLIMSLVALGSVFLLFLILTPSGQELLGGLSVGLEASTVSSRQVLWNEAIHEIAHNPLGIGVAWRNNPHNFLLDSLRNLGLVFGSIYIVIIGSPLFIIVHPKIMKLSSKSVAGIVAYLSVFIHALIEVFFFTKISIVWTFVTLLFIFITINKDLAGQRTYAELANQKYLFKNQLFEKFRINSKGV